MEHITIIYSNAGDTDCQRLTGLWKNIPKEKITLVAINRGDTDWEETVNNAISAETDTLVMCGHGTSYGLLYPDLVKGEYIIHENNYHLIHAKRVICIWCYASSFGDKFHMPGFYTSMYISNINEAYDNGCYHSTEEDIVRSDTIFISKVRYLIVNDIPLSEWVMRLSATADFDDEIDQFNYSGLILID